MTLRHKHQAVWLILGSFTGKVYGVFSTKEGAQAYVNQNSITDDNDLLFNIRRWDVEFKEHEAELI